MMQLLSELMSVDEVDARFARIEMDVMITNIVVWLLVVLAVAGLLIYMQRRVKRENGGWARWRWLLPGCIVFGIGMGLRPAFESSFARAAIAGLAAAVLAGCAVRVGKARGRHDDKVKDEGGRMKDEMGRLDLSASIGGPSSSPFDQLRAGRAAVYPPRRLVSVVSILRLN